MDILIAFVVILFCSILFRNRRTLEIGLWFIDNEYEKYQHLPSYDAMVFHPKHYLRWTVESWQKWLEKQNEK